MWAAWTEHKVFANRRQDLITVIDKALKEQYRYLLRRMNVWIGRTKPMATCHRAAHDADPMAGGR
jgi:hypothetical protein